MKFGPVPPADASGAILAHSVDVPGGGARLRKGLWLTREHTDMLSAAGVGDITVARLDPGDVHEDVAAARLADAAVHGATNLRVSVAATGRVNVYATTRGVVRIDAEAVHQVNRIDPALTIATLPPLHHVQAGEMIATIKIIPYAVADASLDQAVAAAKGALSLAPRVLQTASLIETTAGRDLGPKGAQAIKGRLDKLGVTLEQSLRVPHNTEALAETLNQATGELLLILTASATSDVNDVAPAALRAAGGTVEHYGMPVDPGNLLFLGRLNTKIVIGLPGCARSPALNGADWVIERVVSGLAIGADEITAMGVGGLLKEIPTRPRPREGGAHG